MGLTSGDAGDVRDDLAGRDGIQGRDTSGPTTDGAMTRSEERLHVGTEQAEAGRARLRKYVVTENVTQTVPVSHEEVRLEQGPGTLGVQQDEQQHPSQQILTWQRTQADPSAEAAPQDSTADQQQARPLGSDVVGPGHYVWLRQ